MTVKIKVLAVTVLFWEVCVANFVDESQKDGREKRNCYSPGLNMNAKYNISNDKFPVNVGTAVQYECTSETKLLISPMGNNTWICQSDGSWSNPPPICVHSLTEDFNNTVELISNDGHKETYTLSTISNYAFNNSISLHIYLSGPSTVDVFEVEGTEGLDVEFGEYKQPEVSYTKEIYNKNRTRILFSTPMKISSFMEIKVNKSKCINCRITDLNILSQRGRSKLWCPELNHTTKVLPAGDKCIHFAGNKIMAIKKNAADSVEVCKTSEVNGTLIGPINKNIQLLLQNNADYSIIRYWIGLQSQDLSNWEWSNGEKLGNTTFWDEKDNNTEKCVSLLHQSNFLWVKRDCNRANKWICQTGYLLCGLPDAEPITLRNFSKYNGNFPIETSYYCPKGFTLNGSNIRKCQQNGQWSDKSPNCEKNTDAADRTILNDIMMSSNDDNYQASNVYVMTAIGIIIAIVFISAGIFLILRMKKKDKNSDNKEAIGQSTSFDSEALDSTGDLYEEISLDRRTSTDFQDEDDIFSTENETITDRSVDLSSNVNPSQDQGELNRLPSIKRTLPLPTLPEERKSHLEDQNDAEIKSNAYSSIEELGNRSSIMVENDIYDSFDSSKNIELK